MSTFLVVCHLDSHQIAIFPADYLSLRPDDNHLFPNGIFSALSALPYRHSVGKSPAIRQL